MSRWSMVVGTAALAALVAAGCGKDDKAGKEKPKPAAKPQPKQPEAPKKATPEQLAEHHTKAFAAFNAGDMATFGKTFAADATWEAKGSGNTATGRDAVLAAIGVFRTGFPDLKGETQMKLVNGNQIVSVELMVGTHKGDLMGVPPTGKTAGVPVLHLYEFNDKGEVTKELAYFDSSALMGQLGVSPAPHRAAMEHTGETAEAVFASDADKENANLALMKEADEAMASGDTEKAMALLADDIVIHDYTMPEDITGVDAIKKMNEMWMKAFPEPKYELEWAVAAGDYVARGGVVSGTNTGPIPPMGIKKGTGKDVRYEFAEIARFEDGKVVESWMFGNTMAVAIQLGLVPAPGAEAKK